MKTALVWRHSDSSATIAAPIATLANFFCVLMVLHNLG